jgi:hypothetical protein
MPTEKFSYIALRREGGASSGMATCFRGRGHHLIREVDGFEADLGDAKHRMTSCVSVSLDIGIPPRVGRG